MSELLSWWHLRLFGLFFLLVLTLRSFSSVQFNPEKNSIRLAVDIEAPNSNGTIFTCVSPGFHYAKHFLYMYYLSGFDVKIYDADYVFLNAKVLPVHWCRVSVLKNFNIGRPPWIYIDADTKMDTNALRGVMNEINSYDGLVIANGTERRDHELRTNWFVFPQPRGRRSRKIIETWASNAEYISLQDQAVLTKVYDKCDKGKGVWCWHYTEGPIGSEHCGSHNKKRADCMKDMIHGEEKVDRYRKSTD